MRTLRVAFSDLWSLLMLLGNATSVTHSALLQLDLTWLDGGGVVT
jgi:hypothetical protein